MKAFVSVQKPLRRICKKPDEASSGFREDWLFLANDGFIEGRHDPYSKKYVSIDEEGVVFWIVRNLRSFMQTYRYIRKGNKIQND